MTGRIFWVCCAVAGLSALLDGSAAAQPANVVIRDPNFRSMHMADDFVVASVGDLIQEEPLSRLPDAQPWMKILHSADVATGNCECVLHDIRNYKLPLPTPVHLLPLLAPPAIAKDYAAEGFTFVGRANNQTMGYEAGGMEETDRWLDEAGIAHAGSGKTLTLARAPSYLTLPKGRVAMVSMTSTFDSWDLATDPTGELPAKPGVSGLRTTIFHPVTPVQMEALRNIAKEQGGAPEQTRGDGGGSYGGGHYVHFPLQPDEIRLFGTHFKIGDPKGGRIYRPDPDDVREILQNIRLGKENADFLIATMHAHEQDPKTAQFVIDMAHAAIDAGADMWVGHGQHAIRGIEIYKGKPIFYSLSNFVWQINQAGQPKSGDELRTDALGIDRKTTTDAEFMESSRGDPTGPPTPSDAALLAVSRFDKNQLTEVRVYPIDENPGARAAERGIPRIATGARAQEILAELQRLSAPFGTKITIDKDVAVVQVK